MPSYETCVCVSVCCCEKFGDQRGSLQQIKNLRFGEYSGVGIGILEENQNFIFKVNMRTSQKFSTLAAFLL